MAISFSTEMFGQTDTLIIKAGQSIDDFLVPTSSKRDARNFKNQKFQKTSGAGIACGTYGSRRFRSTAYKNETLGLTFEFKTSRAPWPFQIFHKKRLDKITITKKAKTVDGLIIGKSSRQNVISIYGLLPDWKNESYLSYTDKGIAFRFNDSGTITSIELFAPYEDKSIF